MGTRTALARKFARGGRDGEQVLTRANRFTDTITAVCYFNQTGTA